MTLRLSLHEEDRDQLLAVVTALERIGQAEDTPDAIGRELVVAALTVEQVCRRMEVYIPGFVPPPPKPDLHCYEPPPEE